MFINPLGSRCIVVANQALGRQYAYYSSQEEGPLSPRSVVVTYLTKIAGFLAFSDARKSAITDCKSKPAGTIAHLQTQF